MSPPTPPGPRRPRGSSQGSGPSPRLTRRAYLGLGLVGTGAALTGCLGRTLAPIGPSSTPPDPLPSPSSPSPSSPTVSGDLRQWHTVTLTFDGPDTGEDATPNPFLAYRLDVTFVGPSGATLSVPGYYAADGDAADSDADAGSAWRAHLSPPEAGEWRYTARFRAGADVAIGEDDGVPAAFDGATGTFRVAPVERVTDDFRTKGRLAYVGSHYLRFLGSGEYYLKTGSNSPENFLAYHEFSGTADADGSFLHRYAPHVADWRPGDPTWMDGRGKGIVGAVNYLASVGVNAQFLMPYTVDGGDGGDVWPWTAADERQRFDVSKLAQWERVFEHMTRRGVLVHLVLQETENDRALDGGDLGPTRKLYFRELVARFAHHPALVWNLGEETTLSTAQVRAAARFLRDLDAYDHPITLHTVKSRTEKETVYGPLLGDTDFEGPSLQAHYDVHDEVVHWRAASAAAGRPWVVTADELGDYRCGVPADGERCRGVDQTALLGTALWGALLGGAAGVEWYFGYETAGGDLRLEDYRSREAWWRVNGYARSLLESLPFWEMAPADDALSGVDGYGFAAPGSAYVFYLASSGNPVVTLAPGRYALRWFDPRRGTDVGSPSTVVVTGSGSRTLSRPDHDDDLVAVLTTTDSPQ